DIERAVLIPLALGTRPLGFVYADRPRTDDILLFPKICEVFARLASMAIENIARRLDAEKRAETDPLTGIHNRYFLNRVLEVEIPRVKRYSSPISLLMIDLRDFKRTNDTYGHIFGDHILRETAALIQANIREPDIVVRFGGDEFVVLMVNTSYDQAKLVQERIERAFIERNQAQSDERMMIDISTGLRSADAKTITTLLEDADHQMYLHKAEQTRSEIVEALLGLPSARSDVIDSVISTLLSNLDNKDPSNREHRWRVAHLCLVILRELRLPPADIQTIILAALLHDVGQASLPAEILQRRGSLTESEKRAVQSHSVIGEEFLRGLAHLEPARPIIRHHHERYDGLTTGEFPGYPAGLSGDAIPLGARIVKLADSVDALHSSRPYRKALALDDVIRTIKKESGASFDPKLVEILLRSTDWTKDIDSRQALYDLYREVMKQSIAMEKLRSPYEEVTQPV
ncbi:diguanylate cyclase, partial [Candidatus Sumerlaeota bacterium]|nr:diguanylate cyclase [Candidatus Sumerlaeota bacterium]